MKGWLKRHPFLILGLLTLALFFIMQSTQGRFTPDTQNAMSKGFAVIVLPMYLMWVLVYLLTSGDFEKGPVISVLMMLAGLVPYLLADKVLSAIRKRSAV